MKTDKLTLRDKFFIFKEKYNYYLNLIYLNDNDLKLFFKAFSYSVRLSVVFLFILTIMSIIRLL